MFGPSPLPGSRRSEATGLLDSRQAEGRTWTVDSSRWSPALISVAPAHRRFIDRARTFGLAVVMASLLLASGCTHSDWIDRTLVTVDVTGSWSGMPEGAQFGRPAELFLELRQEGSIVRGLLQSATTQGTSGTGPLTGPINGTVAGDVFHFKDSRGNVEGQMTVSGDEMTGVVSITGTRPITFRRLEPASLPVSPPR